MDTYIGGRRREKRAVAVYLRDFYLLDMWLRKGGKKERKKERKLWRPLGGSPSPPSTFSLLPSPSAKRNI